MKFTRWRPSDVLDLEALIEKDRGRSAEDVRAMDRGFTVDGADRSEFLYNWVNFRRDRGDVGVGHRFRIGIRAFAVILGLVSFVSGAGISWGFLQYRGEALINVTNFFALAVVLQILVLAVSLLLVVFNRFRPGAGAWALRLLRLDVMARQIPLSFPCIRNRLFTVFQAAAVVFNFGILMCLQYRVAFFDLAFGWATTLDVSPERVYQIVNGLALPWRSWFPAAVPTLADIEGSRIQLLEGGMANTREAVTAWWLYLGTAVAAYGLVPRLVLWAVSGGLETMRLMRLRFGNAACEALVLRLRPVAVQHSASTEHGESAPAADTAKIAPSVEGRTFRLVVPDELSSTGLERQVQEGFRITVDDAAATGVLHLFEDWRPPLEETVAGLQDVLQTMDADGVLLLGLVGGVEDERLQPPEASNVAMWRGVMDRKLPDPRVAVLPLLETEA